MTGDRQDGVTQHDATAEFNEALAAGFAAGDFEAIGPFYTEDATLLPPRGGMRDGRAGASAFWSAVSHRFTSASFATTGLKDFGDAARRETGTYTMAGEGQAVEGRYVFVWQLVDGEWQIESAIWNRSGDAAGGPGQGQNRGQNRGQGQGQRRQGGAGGGQGGYRRGGGVPAGGAGQGGGYRQGTGRPSFQGGGGGIGGGRGRAGGGPGGPGGGGPGGDGAGGASRYDGHAGLYANPKE